MAAPAAFPGFTLVFGPRASQSLRPGQIHANEVRQLTGATDTLRYFSLAESRAVPDLVPASLPDIGPELSPNEELRRIFPSAHDALYLYNRVRFHGYKDKASFILCFPAAGVPVEGEYDGMPAEEASAYASSIAPSEPPFLAQDIRSAIRSNLKRHAGVAAVASNKLTVGVWFMVSTRDRGSEHSRDIPLARFGDTTTVVLRETPLMWRPPRDPGQTGIPVRTVISNTDVDMLQYGIEVCDSFKEFMDSELANGKSGRELNTLLIVWVFAERCHSARSSSIHRRVQSAGGRLMREGPIVTEESVLSSRVFASRGLAVQPTALDVDNLCFPRAVMIALDECILARSTSYLPELLRLCARLMHGRIERLDERLAKVGKAKLDEVRALYSKAQEICAVHKRHIRAPDAGFNGRYALRSRMASIESALAAALKSAPESEFKLKGIKRPFLVSDANVTEFRRRMPTLTALQVWTVGGKGRPFLQFPDPRATLAFLLAGGLVANVFVGAGHAGAITSLSECCNHVDSMDRCVYCPLCGESFSRVSRGVHEPLFEHLKRNCKTTQKRFSVPLSSSNMRRMPGITYPALKVSPIVASLAVTFDAQQQVSGASLVARASCNGVVEGDEQKVLWKDFPMSVDWLGLSTWTDWRNFFQTVDEAYINLRPPPTYSLPIRELRMHQGKDALRSIWQEQLSPRMVDAILAQMRFKGPRDAHAFQVLRRNPNLCCDGCLMRLDGPSVWDMEDAIRRSEQSTHEVDIAVVAEQDVDVDPDDICDTTAVRVALECMEQETDSASIVGERILEPQETYLPRELYEWHSSSTGLGGIAHARCAKYINFRGAALTIEVTDAASLAACIDVIFRKEFYAKRCWKGKPPKLSMSDNCTRRVELCLVGTQEPSRYTVLPVVLRLRSSFLDYPVETESESALDLAEQNLKDMLVHAEQLYALYKVWPLALQTGISYARQILMRSSQLYLPPGYGVTSLTSQASLDNVERDMVQGGVMLMGEQTYWPPVGDDPAGKTRLLLDVRAAYPAQMIRWALPWRCHEDAAPPELCFDGRLEEGVDYILRAELFEDKVERVEISGSFPEHLHAFLDKFPPVWQRINVSASMYTPAQRKKLNLSATESLGERSIGHLFPIEHLTVFMRTAKIWQGLGMVFTHVGQVRVTPAQPWARDFALQGEAMRMEAQARLRADPSDTEAKRKEQSIKLLFNSMVGSLNRNMERWTEMKTREETGNPVAEAIADVRYASSVRCGARQLDAGDCTLDQYMTPPKVHRELPLVALFIQEMARCDMLQIWYGSEYIICGKSSCEHCKYRPQFAGIVRTCPSARVIYGCTDSIAIEIPSVDDFVAHHARELDLAGTGKWGLLKEETHFAGLDEVAIQGMNRWAYSVVQNSRTLPQHRGAGGHILKGIPKSWLNRGYTIQDYRAGVTPADAPVLQVQVHTDDLGETKQLPVHRKFLSVFSQKGAVCECAGAWRQVPLGSRSPLARELLHLDSAEV